MTLATRLKRIAVVAAVLLLLYSQFPWEGRALPALRGEIFSQFAVEPITNKGEMAVIKPFFPFRTRAQFGSYLNSHGFTTGAELGVFKGEFALQTLEQWPNCTLYLLVDAWIHLDNYRDWSNRNDAKMARNMNTTLTQLKKYIDSGVVKICRNLTTNCAPLVQDESLDYVFIDARHDYKGVLVDLEDWWPKVRTGGIVAGHDFLEQIDLPKGTQRWDVNFDGTVDPLGRAVRGAVIEFFSEPRHERQIYVSYNEWPQSWVVRK